MSTVTYDKTLQQYVDPQIVSLYWKNPGTSHLGVGLTLAYFGVAAALLAAMGFAGYLLG